VTTQAIERADVSGTAGTGRRYVMCPPTYFEVCYRINPWMRPDEPADAARALEQWRRLHETIVDRGHDVQLVDPEPGLPDMVFAANGGILIGDRALVPRFRHAERAPESDRYAAAFTDLGIGEVRQAEYVNEGEGDFLLIGARMFAGTGFRSDPRAVDEVGAYFGVETTALTLVDPRFYHLDTALARLDAATVVYWPGAFDVTSRGVLRELFPDALLAEEADAASLGLNMWSDGSTVVMAAECERLAARITERGYDVRRLSTDELRKAGGGAKCCVLEHHPPLDT
jgi:N-dimethylarginine dimethylaminohydrolase